jgi:hypothetical protein
MPDHSAFDDVEASSAYAKQSSAAFSAQATGTPVRESQLHRLEQVAPTAGSNGDPDARAHAMKTATHVMAAIDPQNELEGMLERLEPLGQHCMGLQPTCRVGPNARSGGPRASEHRTRL